MRIQISMLATSKWILIMIWKLLNRANKWLIIWLSIFCLKQTLYIYIIKVFWKTSRFFLRMYMWSWFTFSLRFGLVCLNMSKKKTRSNKYKNAILKNSNLHKVEIIFLQCTQHICLTSPWTHLCVMVACILKLRWFIAKGTKKCV